MLADRILFTLKFFDLQQTPLTILELRDFLFNEPQILAGALNENFEISKEIDILPKVNQEQILSVLQGELADKTENSQGFYCLKGRTILIKQHASNLVFRQHREKIIRRFLPMLRLIPFVRGCAVGGSQTLGMPKKESDIDLLVILDPKFLWLGRILVTGYFQITSYRRHGAKIENRFCLNHYLAGPIALDSERDPYNAMEYLRLRPEIYDQTIDAFLQNNLDWIAKFFPNTQSKPVKSKRQSKLQATLEKIFDNPFGLWLNKILGKWQMKRISRGLPAVANQSELSFHSKQRKYEFLTKVFKGLE